MKKYLFTTNCGRFILAVSSVREGFNAVRVLFKREGESDYLTAEEIERGNKTYHCNNPFTRPLTSFILFDRDLAKLRRFNNEFLTDYNNIFSFFFMIWEYVRRGRSKAERGEYMQEVYNIECMQ